MQLIPSRSNRTIREVPASYRPRSNRFPSKSEKTLWKKGSRLGNPTIAPAGTTRMCGSKLLFLGTGRGLAGNLAGKPGTSPPPPVIGVSHPTVPGIAPRRVFALPSTPTTSTRPRTVVVVSCDVACACNPVAPAHNIATQTNILISLIVDNSSVTAHLGVTQHLLAMASCRAAFNYPL